MEEEMKISAWWLIWTCAVLLIGLILGMTTIAYAYDDESIADAIYWTEGDTRARQPYGIETIECNGAECRKICLNTIRNQRKRHANHNCGYTFLECLSRRYCPPNYKVWLENVIWFLKNPRRPK